MDRGQLPVRVVEWPLICTVQGWWLVKLFAARTARSRMSAARQK